VQPQVIANITKNSVVLISNAAQKTTTSSSYIKLKEIIIGANCNNVGSMTILFDLWRSAGAMYAFGKIYYNGVAIGTERTNANSSPTNYSEDFSFTTLKAGDKIQLYGRNTDGTGTTAVQNFNIQAIQNILYNSVV
jgi:hypothetical protein